MLETEIVWQPTNLYGSSSFGIRLDSKFASEMLSMVFKRGDERTFNDLPDKLMRGNRDWYSPFRFHQGTCLINCISLAGGGIELSLNFSHLTDIDKRDSIEYSTHNVSNSSDRNDLLSLFDIYVTHSRSLREKN